ncbi:MAG: DUF928 domain-containing protein [Leptolyngbyaceae cyanobacterium RU_5_1]|nr:DUF928 domain-containing protein [Leptolyngbyaceae cyanobacterium RU_5_1]
MTQLFRPSLLGVAITLAFLSSVSAIPQVAAQSTGTQFTSAQSGGILYSQQSSSKAIPSSVGKPNTRRAQSGKGACPFTENQMKLTALVPKTMNGPQTVSKYPTFWFYVPYTRSNNLSGVFVLQDENGKDIYRNDDVSLPEAPGVISVQIPATAAPLEMEKEYQWFFQVTCSNPTPEVSGWIQRGVIDSTLMKQINAAQPLQRAALYAEQGFWYDALSVIGEKRLLNPQDGVLIKAWASLLVQLELKEVAIKSGTQ